MNAREKVVEGLGENLQADLDRWAKTGERPEGVALVLVGMLPDEVLRALLARVQVTVGPNPNGHSLFAITLAWKPPPGFTVEQWETARKFADGAGRV